MSTYLTLLIRPSKKSIFHFLACPMNKLSNETYFVFLRFALRLTKQARANLRCASQAASNCLNVSSRSIFSNENVSSTGNSVSDCKGGGLTDIALGSLSFALLEVSFAISPHYMSPSVFSSREARSMKNSHELRGS